MEKQEKATVNSRQRAGEREKFRDSNKEWSVKWYGRWKVLIGLQEKKEGNLKLECGWCAHYRAVNKVILTWQRPVWERWPGSSKEIWQRWTMCFSIQKYMEAELGTSWYSYLYLKLAKMLCISYYLLCFLFNKTEEGRTGSAHFGGRWPKQCIYM
jgi:hypothetical protein